MKTHLNQIFPFILLLALGSFQTNEVPRHIQKIGILVRVDPMSQIDHLTNYLNRMSKCQAVEEINIIWIKSDPQSTTIVQSFQNKIKINIPIHFIFQSAIRLFIRPKQSTAQLYFISLVTFPDSCQDIEGYLIFTKLHQKSGLVPLIGEKGRTATIVANLLVPNENYRFVYETNTNYQHFVFAQNLRIISKHFLQLVDINIREIEQMKNKMEPASQQIFLHFITAHLYPQLLPIVYDFKNKLPFVESGHEKNKFIKHCVDVLGSCPSFYQYKLANAKLWANPNIEQIIKIKRQQLQTIINKKQARRLQNHQNQQQINYNKQTIQSINLQTIEFMLTVIAAVLIVGLILLNYKIFELKSLLRLNEANAIIAQSM